MAFVEAICEWVYLATGYSTATPPGPARLLEKLIGGDRVRFVDGAVVSVHRRVNGEVFATIPGDLPRELLSVAIAVAVAEIACLATGHGDDMSFTDWTDVAAAILMPRQALSIMIELLGLDAEAIGKAFVVPLDVAERRLRHAGWNDRSGTFGPSSQRSAG